MKWVCRIEEIVKFWKHLTTFLDLLDPLVVAGTATFRIAILRKSLKTFGHPGQYLRSSISIDKVSVCVLRELCDSTASLACRVCD